MKIQASKFLTEFLKRIWTNKIFKTVFTQKIQPSVMFEWIFFHKKNGVIITVRWLFSQKFEQLVFF